MVELIKPSCQEKNRRTEAVFHLNKKTECSSKLKRKLRSKIRVFMFQLLKSFEGGCI